MAFYFGHKYNLSLYFAKPWECFKPKKKEKILVEFNSFQTVMPREIHIGMQGSQFSCVWSEKLIRKQQACGIP